jgi:hypothetical protein|tara:strand:- start:9 stop:233 length:225 start_codon:yes stop_codon:yes gene_type:complete
MPHKFNANRRDKIPKQKQRVTNWADYNEGLRRCGDLTVWISEDAIGLWSAPIHQRNQFCFALLQTNSYHFQKCT